MDVRAYHGTTKAAADAILANGFVVSQNRFDWLGDGVYFFQDSLERAVAWARDHFDAPWAVVVAEIDLEHCFDLLDPTWFALLNEAYDGVVEVYRREGRSLPRQEGLAHGVDRIVLNYAIEVLDQRGIAISTVRGAFQEGSPAFPGSALFDRSHVQIAVRDVSAIRIVEVVEVTQ
jgi:hypothetical protein